MKPKLVILGTGWAGTELLRRVNTKLYNVVVISSRNHFLFTPLLTSAAVGTLEFRVVAEPIRALLKGKHATFIDATAHSVNAEQKRVECTDQFSKEKFSVPYDKLVVATGGQSNTFGIDGVQEYCFHLKQLSDARQIRQKIIACLEQASNPYITQEKRERLLSFIICGGGPTAIELAGEYSDMVHKDIRRMYPSLYPYVKLTVIEAGNVLLGSFKESLGLYVERQFRRRNVQVLKNSRVVRVDKEKVYLDTGKEIDYGLVVWSAGIGPTPFSQSLPFERESGGGAWRVRVDDSLRVPSHPDVVIVGDLASTRLPATAQVAASQAKHVAKNLNAEATSGAAPTEFTFSPLFSLAYVGGHKALLDGEGDVQVRGLFAFLIWRSAYWTKSVSWQNKLLIPVYWFRSFFFGRDISWF